MGNTNTVGDGGEKGARERDAADDYAANDVGPRGDYRVEESRKTNELTAG
jgi:hypothetical protein